MDSSANIDAVKPSTAQTMQEAIKKGITNRINQELERAGLTMEENNAKEDPSGTNVKAKGMLKP